MDAFFLVFVKKNTKLRKIRRFDFNCLKFNWMVKLYFDLWSIICENIQERSTGCIFGFFREDQALKIIRVSIGAPGCHTQVT